MSTNTSANDDTDSILEVFDEVPRQVPPFWQEEPALWFSRLEAEYVSSGIAAESTKLYYVLGQLEHQYALEFKDVIATPPQHSKYLQLKRELISRLTPLQEKKALLLPKDKELSPDSSVDKESLQTGISAAIYSVKQDFVIERPSDIHPEFGTETSIQANLYQEHAFMRGLELDQEFVKMEEEEKGGEYDKGGMKQELTLDGSSGESSGYYTEASTLAVLNQHSVKIEPGCVSNEETEEKEVDEEWGCDEGGMKQELSEDRSSGDSSEHETETSILTNLNRHSVKIEPGCVDEEETGEEKGVEEEWWCGISEEAARAGLYAGHVVKRELVLGPELLQALIVAPHPGTSAETSTASQDLAIEETISECPVEGTCSMRSERHPIDEHRQTSKEQLCGSASMAERQSITEVTNDKVTFGQINTADKPYICHVCDKVFSSNQSLKNHFRIHKTNKAYACDMCSKQFPRSSHLTKHRRFHTGERPYVCDICNKRFSQSSNLLVHKRTHTGEKPYTCDICNRPFTQSSHLIKHKRTHTGEKPYECDICNKRFAVSSGLVKHKLYHKGDESKPYTCEICNKHFTDGYYLKDHKLIHAENKLHTCEICKRQYAHLRNLITHKRIHTEKKQSCDICYKQFTRRCLKAHKRIHTEEKLHACDICNKRFLEYGGLVKHKLIHTGDKPYMCEICNKQFLYRYMLNQHKRVHTDDNPSCDICNKQFTRSNDLIRHIRIHTGEKPYTCDICNKQFIQKSGIKEHIRRIHTRPCKRNICKVKKSRRGSSVVRTTASETEVLGSIPGSHL